MVEQTVLSRRSGKSEVGKLVKPDWMDGNTQIG